MVVTTQLIYFSLFFIMRTTIQGKIKSSDNYHKTLQSYVDMDIAYPKNLLSPTY